MSQPSRSSTCAGNLFDVAISRVRLPSNTVCSEPNWIAGSSVRVSGLLSVSRASMSMRPLSVVTGSEMDLSDHPSAEIRIAGIGTGDRLLETGDGRHQRNRAEPLDSHHDLNGPNGVQEGIGIADADLRAGHQGLGIDRNPGGRGGFAGFTVTTVPPLILDGWAGSHRSRRGSPWC